MNPPKLDESPRSVAAPRQKIVASALWADVFPRLQAPSFSFQLFSLSVDQRPSAVKKLAVNFSIFHLPFQRRANAGCPISVLRPPVRGGGTFFKSFLNKHLKQNQAKKRENREKYAKKVNKS